MEDGDNATVAIGVVGDFNSHWWWALASAGQLTWGISASRRVCNYRLVPYKALGVATLFVSAGASAAVSTLHACGIRTVRFELLNFCSTFFSFQILGKMVTLSKLGFWAEV